MYKLLKTLLETLGYREGKIENVYRLGNKQYLTQNDPEKGSVILLGKGNGSTQGIIIRFSFDKNDNYLGHRLDDRVDNMPLRDIDRLINYLDSLGFTKVTLQKLDRPIDDTIDIDRQFECYNYNDFEYSVLSCRLRNCVKFRADPYHYNVIIFDDNGHYLTRELSTW